VSAKSIQPAAELPDHLFVLLGGEVAGKLMRSNRDDQIDFTYEDSWRLGREAYALSLSLPLAGRTFAGQTVSYYLKGLLSDDPSRLSRIAAQYGVAPTDAFGLLANVGEDCPGAVQFARPDRLDAMRGAGPGHITWLSESQVASILRGLATENSELGTPSDEGQFSLPGALPKVALRWDPRRKRWGRPSGRAATTHILKPPRTGIPFHCQNEHLCLELARELGLDSAHSSILTVEDQTVLSVERYDREIAGGSVVRVHQEDMSQALGADPDLKYAAQNAPTLSQIVALLRQWSPRAIEESLQLVQAVAYNWAIAGTDAHPRNYSVLIRPGDVVSLAPLYDIASSLLIDRKARRAEPETWRLAMAIGGRTAIGEIDREAWSDEARRAGLRANRVLERVEEIVSAIPDAAVRVVARAVAVSEGIDGAFADRFVRDIRAQCAKRLASLR
jgi:serine/threonine-protein kinase HipA